MFEQIVKWTQHQFPQRGEDMFEDQDLFALACRMYDTAMQDKEFWGNQPLWNLYNHVRQS